MNFKAHVERSGTERGYETGCSLMHLSLSAEGCKILYETKVRPTLEYAPLTWMSCPTLYLSPLDSVDERAQRINRCCGEGSIVPAQSSAPARCDKGGGTVQGYVSGHFLALGSSRNNDAMNLCQ